MKAECSPEMAISLVMLYHKTQFVIFVYCVSRRMRIWWHVAEYCINFYQDPVVTLLRSTQRDAANQPQQPAAAAWEAGRDAVESLAGETPMALKECKSVRELDTAGTIYTHDQVYKEICHLSGPKSG